MKIIVSTGKNLWVIKMSKEDIVDQEITEWCLKRKVRGRWFLSDEGIYYLVLEDLNTNEKVDYLVGNKDAKYSISLKYMINIFEVLFEDLQRKNKIADYKKYLTKYAIKHYNGDVEKAKESKICLEVKKYYGL